jgi:signal transduction histidine kinase
VRNGGLGLKGMRERLEAVGGSLRIISAPGNGAEIRFRLPLGS